MAHRPKAHRLRLQGGLPRHTVRPTAGTRLLHNFSRSTPRLSAIYFLPTRCSPPAVHSQPLPHSHLAGPIRPGRDAGHRARHLGRRSPCPPADKWLSTLKAAAASGQAVVQAFHVGYGDYIGWVDRFAVPAHTVRQKQVAAQDRLTNIYTPQLVRDGQDWRNDGASDSGNGPARARSPYGRPPLKDSKHKSYRATQPTPGPLTGR